MGKSRFPLVILFACLTLASALAAGAGCGGNVGQAKQYAQEGDALFNVAIAIGNKLDASKGGLQRLMVANDVAGVVAIEPEIRGLLTEMDKSTKTMDKAIAKYRKVISLKGADDYKEYASIQMEASFKEQEALTVGRDLVNYVIGLVDAAKAGRPVNLTDSLKAVSTSVNNLDKLERDLVNLRRQASDFALDHNLF